MSELTNNAQAIIDVAKTAEVGGKVISELNKTYLLVPEGYDLQELEDPQQTPYFIDKDQATATPGDFLEYFNRFSNDESTVFCDFAKANFTGVIDHHASDGTADRGNHIVKYSCPVTVEWSRWKLNDKKTMSQQDFALFIEDNTPDIIKPDGAEMLEIALSLQANNKVNFKSALRLDNGQVQLKYQEDIEGTAGAAGQLNIPTEFTIAVKLFEGGDPYELDARFRYRIKEGQLFMWYELIRPHITREHAIQQVADVIKGGIDKGFFYREA